MSAVARHPQDRFWQAIRHFGGADDLESLRKLLPHVPVSQADVDRLLAELARSPELRAALDTPGGRLPIVLPADVEGDRFAARLALAGRGRARALFLYVATRLLAPEVVIETGCLTGWDSAVLLQALARNHAGRLYTIDLPAKPGQFSQLGADQGLPAGFEPGFLVPDSLRDRWTLLIGNVRDELLPLLEKVRSVDLFYHDSEHTYVQMMWEYTTAWPYLTEDAIVVSDDIAWNRSLWDFARGVGRPFVLHRSSPNFGAVPRSAA